MNYSLPPVARKIAIGAAIAGATHFAVEGGEYGTSDLLRQRVRRVELRASVDSLQRIVDSLTRVRKLVQTDPRLQERIAREEFGMVRGDKELLYRFVAPGVPGAGGRR